MLSKDHKEKQVGFTDIEAERFIPEGHELMRIRDEVDFSFIDEELRDYYSEDIGRPSYPPSLLFKMLFLEWYDGLSDVKISQRVGYNLLYRRFLRLSISEDVPDDTTLVKFRSRIGDEGFRRILFRIIEICKDKGLLKGRYKLVDATHIIADVAIPSTIGLLRQARKEVIKIIRKRLPKTGERLESEYLKGKAIKGGKPTQEELAEEIEITKRFFDDTRERFDEEVKAKVEELNGLIYGSEQAIVSLVDPDARFGHKSKDKVFAGYKAHVVADESEIVTSVEIIPGNMNEGVRLEGLLREEQERGIKGEAVVADALYDSSDNRGSAHELGMRAYIPMRKEEKHLNKFYYDAERQRVRCRAGEWNLGRIAQERGYLYYFSVEQCKGCPYRDEYCPIDKEGRARVYVSEDHRLKLIDDDTEKKEAKRKRSIIERVFGRAKKWHQLGRARYRGRWRVAIQVYMSFFVMNVKRMVKILTEREMCPIPDTS